MTLESERRHLDRVLGWEGYEILEGQDRGDAYVFKIRKKTAGKGVKK